jgi:O-antigen/teichoic acid export membrane protein
MNPNTGEAKLQPIVPPQVLVRAFANHKHLFVAGSAWISRIIIALVQLVSIRVLMGSLGVEQYAMFALLMGLLHWYMLSDIGLGISTQNRISECRAQEAPYDRYVAAAGLIAILLLFLSILVLYLATPYLAQQFLQAFPAVSAEEKARSFFLTGTLFIAVGIGTISYKVWYAEHRGYLSHIMPAVASLIGLLGIVLLDNSEYGSSIYAAILVFNAPAALLAFGSLLVQFARSAESIRAVNPSIIRGTLVRAAKFWITAILATAVLQIDYLVISQVLAPQEIVVYLIATKIFGFIAFFFTSILWALWPTFAESISRGAWDRVKQSLARCIRLGMIFVASATVALVYAAPYISEILAPDQDIQIPTQLILLMGTYHLIRVWNDVYAVILQSMNVLWPLWVFVPVQAVICVGLQYSLAPIYGANGIVLGLIGSFILTVIWGLPLAANRQFEKLRNHHQVRK